MRKPEQQLWDYLKRGMLLKWEAQRHEDKYSTGIPDVSYSIGRHGWIELKRLKSKPVNNDTILHISHYTADQKNWLFRHGSKGGACFILLQIENVYMLFGWESCVWVGEMTYDEHIKAAIRVWTGNINWDELCYILEFGYLDS